MMQIDGIAQCGGNIYRPRKIFTSRYFDSQLTSPGRSVSPRSPEVSEAVATRHSTVYQRLTMDPKNGGDVESFHPKPSPKNVGVVGFSVEPGETRGHGPGVIGRAGTSKCGNAMRASHVPVMDNVTRGHPPGT